MNAPLPVLLQTPKTHNADSVAQQVGRNRADTSQTLRSDRADAAPPERFSDELRKAADRRTDQNREKTPQQPDDASAGGAEPKPTETPAEQTTGPTNSNQTDASVDQASANGNQAGESGATTGTDSGAKPVVTSGQANIQAVGDGSASATPTPGDVAATNNAPSSNHHPVADQTHAAQSQLPATDQSARTELTGPSTAPAAQQIDSNSVQTNQPSGVPDGTRPNIEASTAQPTRMESQASTTTASSADAHAVSHSASNSVNQQSSHSTGGETNNQQQSTNSQAQQLQQNLQKTIASGQDPTATGQTAAERRAGQVNASVQFEQSTGFKPIALETATAPAVTSALGHSPSLDLGVLSRSTVQPAGAPTALPIDESVATGNVVRGLSALVNQRGGVMHMRLDPPELGQLRVQMQINQGTVTAQFQAATAEAHAVLERNMTALRTALERHGLSVEKLTVQVQQPSQGQQTAGQQLGDHNAQQHNSHDAGGNASRGRGEQSADQHGRQQSFAEFAHDELNSDFNLENNTIATGPAA